MNKWRNKYPAKYEDTYYLTLCLLFNFYALYGIGGSFTGPSPMEPHTLRTNKRQLIHNYFHYPLNLLILLKPFNLKHRLAKTKQPLLKSYLQALMVLNKYTVPSSFSCKAVTDEWTELSTVGTTGIKACLRCQKVIYDSGSRSVFS